MKCIKGHFGIFVLCAVAISPVDQTAAATLYTTNYPTIQAAVDAAQSGDTIVIATGDYYEQIAINNKASFTLAGEPGAVLHATAGMGQNLQPWTRLPALVGIVQSEVTLSGLTFDGDRQAGAYPDAGLQGVFYLASSGSVRDCTIRGFRGALLDALSNARALVAWNPKSAGTDKVQVNIISNNFEDNERSITLTGDDTSNPTLLRTAFTIEANTITGLGPAPMVVRGVLILTGAGGLVRGNTVTDHQCTRTGDSYASGIKAFDGWAVSRNPSVFVPLQAIRFEGNTFRNNSDHLVLINAPNSEIINNVFEGTGARQPRWGAVAISGSGIRIENNDFSDSPTGIHCFGEDHYWAGWPLTTIAGNSVLTGNWFSSIPNPLQIQPGVVGLQQQGTRLPPFHPEFVSITRTDTNQSQGLMLTVRSWHGTPIVLETSTHVSDWLAVATNAAPRPSSEFTRPIPDDTRQQFYRLGVREASGAVYSSNR